MVGEQGTPKEIVESHSHGTWKTPYIPSREGIDFARKRNNVGGRGCWKKRMPCCNGMDRAAEMWRYST
jgi:hypothetical protein